MTHKSKKQKRGQAALEFLSTYGFAFLIILVMIGALAYFGVLDPQRFLPDRCQFGSEFGCIEAQITTDGATPSNVDVAINLINNAGQDIVYQDVVLDDTLGTVWAATDCTMTAPWDTAGTVGVLEVGEVWSAGRTVQAVCTTSTPAGTQLAAGSKHRVNVEIDYTPVGKSFPKSGSGDIYSEVQ